MTRKITVITTTINELDSRGWSARQVETCNNHLTAIDRAVQLAAETGKGKIMAKNTNMTAIQLVESILERMRYSSSNHAGSLILCRVLKHLEGRL